MAVIIVVDDEEAIAELIRDLLIDLGHQSIIAFNGKEALQKLNALPEPPALIVSDVMMPFIDGLALAQRVKMDHRWTTVPVVLMSAVHNHVGDSSVDAFVKKPFDLDQLTAVILSYLDGSTSPSSDATR